MQFSQGLRWLAFMKRTKQAGRSVSISLSPWQSVCSSATSLGCPPAIVFLGQQLWQLCPDHVLISSALLRDTAQYQQQIIPVVEALF